MAFKFRWLCDLLQTLEHNRLSKASAAARTVDPDTQIIVAWFNKHNAQIPRRGEPAVAFLSCMFPERRPDRVYSLQRMRLASTFGRGLGLGTGRMKELNSWQERDGADFPRILEAVMAQAEFSEPLPGQEVTLEELDEALNELAAWSPFSSPAIRCKMDPREAHVILSTLLHRLQSWEAKWFVRLVLKNFSPVIVPEQVAMDQFHFLLRDLLDLQSSFDAAVAVLSRARISQLPPRPAGDCQAALKFGVMGELVPQVGVMVKMPPYEKARSIKHCCQMAESRHMSLERKYDGEYCQVHIDMTKGSDCIKIFSKSGKDSTTDRVRLHGVLKDCLGISTTEGRIKRHCILEGELLVWSDKTKAIEPFHKIRKHVQRSGRWLGNQADSPASLHEHLMMVFYDILLLDENILLRKPHSKRRRVLESLVKCTPGWAEIGTREKIDFSSRRAPEQLRAAFASAITQHWEGFVLKGCDDPYIPMDGRGRCIKLKKDYITGLGDTLDFAIVAGRWDPKAEQDLHLGKLSWTSFYIGCLENKAELDRFDAKPIYRIVDLLNAHNISNNDIQFLNEHGKFVQAPFAACREELEVKFDQKTMARPTEVFKQAFVAEICGASFDKLPNTRSFTLRFPRVLKIHSDRPISKTVSFDELQQLGLASCHAPIDADSQKDREWIERLEKSDPKSHYIIDKSQSTTPRRSPGSTTTASTTLTPNMRTEPCSPVLVRSDTLEVSPTEPSKRDQTDSRRLSSSQSPSEPMLRVSKRKLISADHTPEANTSSKKVRFSEVAYKTPGGRQPQLGLGLNLQEVVSSPCERAIVRTNATASGAIKTTPPWCKWSRQYEPSSPLPQVKIKPSNSRVDERGTPARGMLQNTALQIPKTREPLSEVTNLSPQHKRLPTTSAIQPLADRANEQRSPRLGPASMIKKIQEAVSMPQNICVTANVAILTTPATSSPTGAEPVVPVARSKNVNTVQCPAKRLQEGLKSSPSHLSATQQPSQAQQSPSLATPPSALASAADCTALFASTILLSKSLIHLSTHPARPLEKMLRNTAAAFTYSTTHFLNTLTITATSTTTARPHVVLVDTARPDTVAREMKLILKQLNKKLRTKSLRAKGRVIFLDWNALQPTTREGTASTALPNLKRYFGGCLAWSPKKDGHPNSNGNSTNVSIESIWRWDEAMAFRP
jgi:DNA ligase 4